MKNANIEKSKTHFRYRTLGPRTLPRTIVPPLGVMTTSSHQPSPHSHPAQMN